MANFNITINAAVNLPPSSVGDNTITINHAQTRVFTAADFTTNTTPAYADPEGDAPQNLRVLTLPANGTLMMNAIPVVLNQVISFTNISAGNFSYQSDPAINTARSVLFSFEISDVGSGQYTG